MKNMSAVFKGAVLALGCLALFSCNPLENKSDSASLLILERIEGLDAEGNSADYLESDVVTVDQQGNSSVFEDPAVATFSARLLDPNPLFDPSQYNDILITRYVVRYTRSDGRNREGVDVPYGFEGSLSVMVKVGTITDVSFVLVRAVAKLEPPLVNLAVGRAEGELEVTAHIDFYGHDMMNKSVKASGQMSIFFADWAD
ncbi:MAG: hypothetical protein JW742_01045 [Candidatus Aminicenantes bacterium]|nr:hypothetical protein [Candidatus Aminicenantes bacterium]